MFTGLGSLSIVKRDTANQRSPAIGFQKTVFATKAANGDSTINLASMTVPTEMSANGFVQPSLAILTAANLLFFRRNLKLWSSLRGDMIDYYQYTVSSSTIITFVGFVAEEGEIFVGTIDYNATTGSNVVATVTPPATGSLPATTTDFNTGFPFTVGLYPSQQSGAVYVYRNGQLQVRNTGNATASVSADGDYQEVDAGTGLGTIIRFNRPDPDNAGTIVVVPSGRLYELPNGSNQATLEAIQGQVNSMASYVAAALGQTVTTILGSAPTQQDLKAFGDRVLALEQTVAFKGVSNVWTAYQAIPGRSDGIAITSGYIGEVVTVALAGIQQVSPVAGTFYDDANTLTLGPGTWVIYCGASLRGSVPGGISATIIPTIGVALRTGSTSLRQAACASGSVNGVDFYGFGLMTYPVTISATTVYKQSIRFIGNTGSPTLGQINSAAFGGESFLFAVRVG